MIVQCSYWKPLEHPAVGGVRCADRLGALALGANRGRDDLQLAIIRREFEHRLFERTQFEGVESLSSGRLRVTLLQDFLEPAEVVGSDRWDDVDAACDLFRSRRTRAKPPTTTHFTR